MKKLKLLSLSILFVFGTTFAAEEVERKMEVKVVVAGGSAGDAAGITQWSTKGMEFDLEDLAVGETRAIEGDAGSDATITRSEDGFTLNVDGQSIVLPDIDAHATHMAFVDGSEIDQEIDIQVISDHAGSASDDVTIISSKPLDSSVQETIKSVLVSAGNNDDVVFIDGSNDRKRMVVVDKVVEVIQ